MVSSFIAGENTVGSDTTYIQIPVRVIADERQLKLKGSDN